MMSKLRTKLVSVVAAVTAITCLSSVTAGCGYALSGRGSFLPDYIETIGVPMFENVTTIFEVEQLLTEQVRQAFINRGRYRVVPETTGVDAVLE